MRSPYVEGMMGTAMSTEPSSRALRLWPGIAAALLLILFRFGIPIVAPDAAVVGMISGPILLVAVVVWWLLFSRAPWLDRLAAIAVMVVAVVATRLIVHASIRGGMMGMMLPIYAVPVTLVPAFIGWAVASGRQAAPARRLSMVATILLACGVWTLA